MQRMFSLKRTEEHGKFLLAQWAKNYKCITPLITGAGFPENFLNLHPWKYSAHDYIRPETPNLILKLSPLNKGLREIIKGDTHPQLFLNSTHGN